MVHDFGWGKHKKKNREVQKLKYKGLSHVINCYYPNSRFEVTGQKKTDEDFDKISHKDDGDLIQRLSQSIVFELEIDKPEEMSVMRVAQDECRPKARRIKTDDIQVTEDRLGSFGDTSE